MNTKANIFFLSAKLKKHLFSVVCLTEIDAAKNT